jgi:hypothetical protein
MVSTIIRSSLSVTMSSTSENKSINMVAPSPRWWVTWHAISAVFVLSGIKTTGGGGNHNTVRIARNIKKNFKSAHSKIVKDK